MNNYEKANLIAWAIFKGRTWEQLGEFEHSQIARNFDNEKVLAIVCQRLANTTDRVTPTPTEEININRLLNGEKIILA